MLIRDFSEIPGPLAQIGDGGEGAVLAERPHVEDFGFGDLFDAPGTSASIPRLASRRRQGQRFRLPVHLAQHGLDSLDRLFVKECFTALSANPGRYMVNDQVISIASDHVAGAAALKRPVTVDAFHRSSVHTSGLRSDANTCSHSLAPIQMSGRAAISRISSSTWSKESKPLR